MKSILTGSLFFIMLSGVARADYKPHYITNVSKSTQVYDFTSTCYMFKNNKFISKGRCGSGYERIKYSGEEWGGNYIQYKNKLYHLGYEEIDSSVNDPTDPTSWHTRDLKTLKRINESQIKKGMKVILCAYFGKAKEQVELCTYEPLYNP